MLPQHPGGNSYILGQFAVANGLLLAGDSDVFRRSLRVGHDLADDRARGTFTRV